MTNSLNKAYARIFSLLLVASLANCDVINPEEQSPSILSVTEFEFQTDPLKEGSASSKITEVWVTVNQEFLGAYPLPAEIPVLFTGRATVRLEAGIRDNGISSTPEIYPFFIPFETEIDLLPEQRYEVRPQIRYQNNVNFGIIEDFEDGNRIFAEVITGGLNGGISIAETDAFEGSGSGRIVLKREEPVIEIASTLRFSGLNARSPFVYLELNYKSEVPVVFGIIGHNIVNGDQGVRLFEQGFFSNAEWNKIYFNLSPVLANNEFAEYQIGFQAFIPAGGDGSTLESAEILLDNIKLLHF